MLRGYADTPLTLVRSSKPSVYNSGTVMTLTGATGIKLQRTLTDKNNTQISFGSNQSSIYSVPNILGFNTVTPHSLTLPILKVSISGANRI